MKRPWLCIAACAALGEALAYVSGTSVPIVTAVITVVVTGMLIISYKQADKKRAVILIGIAFLFGFLRLTAADLYYSRPSRLSDLSNVPDPREYTASVTGIDVRAERTVLRCGELLVYCDDINDDSVRIGNTVCITGEFSTMDIPRNPGEFNYRLYYLSEGITHRCFAENIYVTDDHVDLIPQMLHEIRRNILSHISSIYDASDAGILRAALLGDKSMLDDDLYKLYQQNGIAHLLAISGLHVGILGMSLYKLLREKIRLSFLLSALISSAVIAVYCILTGSGVSTVRAAIMLILVFSSGILGRRNDLLNSSGLAAFCILLFRPYELFSCGFMLSFSAVIAIGGPAAKLIKEMNISNRMLQALIISICVTLTSLPITAYFFFEIPLFGCLLNLIVIPLMTYVVWSGILAVLLSYVFVPAALIAAGTGHYILRLYTVIGQLTSRLPLSSILIGRPRTWQIIVYYCLYFVFLFLSPLEILKPRSHSLMSDRVTEST